MNLAGSLAVLDNLPAETASISGDVALAAHLSAFVLRFYPPAGQPAIPQIPQPQPHGQPDFWLFLPFATAPDFPRVPLQDVRQLALASTYMILYNILFDAVVDDPGQPDTAVLILAERVLTTLQQHLYALFPPDSSFWAYYRPLYDQFLAAVLEEKDAHKGTLRPYAYPDFHRLVRDKMSMVLMNPIGLALLDGTPERIPTLLAAWHEINVAVVILDDIKDWEEDYSQANYTYLLTQALAAGSADDPLLETLDEVTCRVLFSGVMEALYERGAVHLLEAAERATEADAPALAELARERAEMFLKFRCQLVRRKVITLHRHLKMVATGRTLP